MRAVRRAIWWYMDRACEWSGHRLLCYNEPRWINRLWFWAYTFDE